MLIVIEIPFRVNGSEFMIIWNLMNTLPKTIKNMSLDELDEYEKHNKLSNLEKQKIWYYRKKRSGYDYSHTKNERTSKRSINGKKKVKDMSKDEYDQYRREYYAENKERIKRQSRTYYWKKRNSNND